jgi:hypothetical protein
MSLNFPKECSHDTSIYHAMLVKHLSVALLVHDGLKQGNVLSYCFLTLLYEKLSGKSNKVKNWNNIIYDHDINFLWKNMNIKHKCNMPVKKVNIDAIK